MKISYARFVVGVALLNVAAGQDPDQDFAERVARDPLGVVETMPVHAPESKGFEFTVLDPMTGATVAGASVVWSPWDHDRNQNYYPTLAPRITAAQLGLRDLAFGCRFGKRYVSDENGRVVIPGIPQSAVTAVFRGRLGWQGCWGSGGGPIKLHRCRWLRVQVNDANGRPAEGLFVRAKGGGGWTVQATHTVATDRIGLGLVSVEARPVNPFRLFVDVETNEPVSRTLQPAELEGIDEPVSFRLRREGTVRLTVVDEAGRPRNDVERVLMTRDRRTIQWGKTPAHRPAMGRLPTRPNKSGGVYRHVGVGIGELRFRINLDGTRGELRGTGVGPTKLGAVSEIRIVSTGLIDSRIHGPDGAPFANQPVVVGASRTRDRFRLHRRPFEGTFSFRVKTGADGRIRFVLPLDAYDPKERITVGVGHRVGTFHYHSSLFFRRTVDPASADLRKIRLSKTPIELSGVVVDEAGSPIPGVLVRSSGTHMATDGEGRFALRGIPTGEQSYFWAQRSGYQRRDERFAFGRKDLRIVMKRAASLRGAFDGPIPDTMYRPKVALVDASGTQPDGAFCAVLATDSNPKIEAEFFPSGTYAFVIRRDGRVVHRIEGIKLVAGETCRDPRLQRVPWETYLRKVRIRVIDADKKPVPNARVTHWQVRPRHASRGTRGRTDASGGVSLWVPKEKPRLLIETPNHRWMRLENVIADRTVEVTAEPGLSVEFDREPKLPQDVRLEAWWQFDARSGPAADPWHLRRGAFQKPSGFASFAGKQCHLELPDPTEFRIEIRARLMVDGKPRPKTEVVGTLVRAARAGETPLRFEWTQVSETALAESVRKLRQR